MADMLVLRLDDVDLGNRRIIIGGRVRLLDDLTHQLLADWLRHRQTAGPTPPTRTCSSTTRPP
ncbi:hypothetical protein [Microbispora sp. GKU 823]|uniref:hypothetical protein n=1 Tax=Microbispora sp. GKU 823 TaxID=1652100 RepID=UPI00117D36A9|nr:hypothetical protein [Microbispora sp. GKU 823]